MNLLGRDCSTGRLQTLTNDVIFVTINTLINILLNIQLFFMIEEKEQTVNDKRILPLLNTDATHKRRYLRFENFFVIIVATTTLSDEEGEVMSRRRGGKLLSVQGVTFEMNFWLKFLLPIVFTPYSDRFLINHHTNCLFI